MAFRIRRVTPGDAKLLWQWRNTPVVRENSFNTKRISWVEHKVWFKKRVASPDTRIYLLEKDRRPIAQIRYERRDDSLAEIDDITVASGERGHGYGKRILIDTVPLACKELKVTRLIGFVKEKNKASTRTFLSAGFSLQGKVTKQECVCNAFTYTWEKGSKDIKRSTMTFSAGGRAPDILSTALNADFLTQRIQSNVCAQQVDLNEWLFKEKKEKNIPVARHVLELCCGTGSQTRYLLEHVGGEGQVVALDASAEALTKLEGQLSPEQRARLKPVNAKLEELDQALLKRGFMAPSFDWIFCAYGLYYSQRTEETLAELSRWLQPTGQLTIVGPFGQNNNAIFNLVESAGVAIPNFVKYTSTHFMFEPVIPYVSSRFESVSIKTLVNPVIWHSAEEVLNYWSHTTFYDSSRRPALVEALAKHFDMADSFINEKWVMRLDATGLRGNVHE